MDLLPNFLHNLEENSCKNVCRDRKDEPDTATPIASKHHIILLGRKHTRGMTARKNSTSYNTKEIAVKKNAYTDRSKSTGRKVDFVAVFMDIIKRGALQKK